MTSLAPYASDFNVSPAAFKDPSVLHVSKVFGPTIQGEGPYQGRPALFVRLAGCNRGDKAGPAGCAWCDADFRLNEASAEYLPALTAKLKAMIQLTTRPWEPWLVVITGGEPLLQAAALLPWVDYLRAGRQFEVQLETNGDYLTSEALFVFDKVVISPKAGNVGRWPPTLEKIKQALLECAKNSPRYTSRLPYLKLLVSADPDSIYHAPPPWFDDWLKLPGAAKRTFFQPLTAYTRHPRTGEVGSMWSTAGLVDAATTRANHAHAAHLALAHHVRVSVQAHMLLDLE